MNAIFLAMQASTMLVNPMIYVGIAMLVLAYLCFGQEPSETSHDTYND